jgi:hypothetical protein
MERIRPRRYREQMTNSPVTSEPAEPDSASSNAKRPWRDGQVLPAVAAAIAAAFVTWGLTYFTTAHSVEPLSGPPVAQILKYKDGVTRDVPSTTANKFILTVELVGRKGQPDDGRTVWVFTRPVSQGGRDPDDFYDGTIYWPATPCNPSGPADRREYVCDFYLGVDAQAPGLAIEYSVWVGLVDQDDLRVLTQDISRGEFGGGIDEERPSRVDLLPRLTYTRTS